jgi:lysozyme
MTVEAPQHVSLDGAKFVAVREALVTRAYHDGEHKDGTPKWSIGFGSQTPPPKEGDTISIEDAFDRLRDDITAREAAINKALKVPVSQGAFDALFSLYYQAGTAAMQAVAEQLNEGSPIVAAMELLRWNSGADKKPTDGHTRRRLREAIMLIDGNYGDLSKVLVFDGNPREVDSVWMPFPDLL